MSWNRSLLAAVIVITTAFSALAQVASTTDQSQPLANPPDAPATLKSASGPLSDWRGHQPQHGDWRRGTPEQRAG